MNRPPAARCRSCGAPIMWTVCQPNGTRMPVDLAPVPEGNVVIVRLDGARPPTVRVLGQDEQPPGPARFVSHFATCPHADGWRDGGAS